jgi:hypothetical protein
VGAKNLVAFDVILHQNCWYHQSKRQLVEIAFSMFSERVILPVVSFSGFDVIKNTSELYQFESVHHCTGIHRRRVFAVG